MAGLHELCGAADKLRDGVEALRSACAQWHCSMVARSARTWISSFRAGTAALVTLYWLFAHAGMPANGPIGEKLVVPLLPTTWGTGFAPAVTPAARLSVLWECGGLACTRDRSHAVLLHHLMHDMAGGICAAMKQDAQRAEGTPSVLAAAALANLLTGSRCMRALDLATWAHKALRHSCPWRWTRSFILSSPWSASSRQLGEPTSPVGTQAMPLHWAAVRGCEAHVRVFQAGDAGLGTPVPLNPPGLATQGAAPIAPLLRAQWLGHVEEWVAEVWGNHLKSGEARLDRSSNDTGGGFLSFLARTALVLAAGGAHGYGGSALALALLPVCHAMPPAAPQPFYYYVLHIPARGYAVFSKWSLCNAHAGSGGSQATQKKYRSLEDAIAFTTSLVGHPIVPLVDVWYPLNGGPPVPATEAAEGMLATTISSASPVPRATETGPFHVWRPSVAGPAKLHRRRARPPSMLPKGAAAAPDTSAPATVESRASPAATGTAPEGVAPEVQAEWDRWRESQRMFFQ